MSVIKLIGARQNNLKNLNLEIPLESFVCITGPSGSGKSSLAFETLYAEGYRRYVESLSTYARQFFEKIPKPDLDHIENICPSIAVQQKNPVRNSRSTVGTSTEVYDYLRLLFAKLGETFCPNCGKKIQAETPPSAADVVLAFLNGKSDRAYVGFPLSQAEKVETLIEKGFLRKLQSASQPEVIELETEKGTLKSRSLIVFDRILVDHTERHRLVESLEGSFREGAGEAFVYLLEAKEFFKFSSDFRCATCDIAMAKPTPLLFSYNSPLGACNVCKGFGNTLEYDEKLYVPNPRLSLKRGAIEPFTKLIMKRAQKRLLEFAEAQNIPTDVPFAELTDEERKLLTTGRGSYKGIIGHFKKAEEKRYKMHVRIFLRRYQSEVTCTACKGSRLRKEALYVKVKGKTLFDLCMMSLAELEKWFGSLSWSQGEQSINKEVLRQIRSRLHFLNRMGLTYLSLHRLSRTLSGGESQRITLANQLGAELSGTLYVLDEPSIGLHPSDRDRLLNSLDDLVQMGNSVVVVEHDLDTIRHAHQVIELGPGSGRQGGEIVFQGRQKDFEKSKTLTARYLRREVSVSQPQKRRGLVDEWLSIEGATENNLKNISLRIPLHRFVGVAGVSGSGKSTLIHQTLFNSLARLFHQSTEAIGRFKKLFGAERLRGVSLLDQSPLGRSSRSIPLTMIGAMDDVRAFFAASARAQALHLTTKHFSFNTPGGRCDNCSGDGVVKTEMYFLDDLYLPCEVCGGKRYKPEVLEVKVRGKNIYDVFQMSVDEGRAYFRDRKGILEKLELLQRVGLGYLQLGQGSQTLSGGESQRLKIAAELLNRRQKDILYILDEPTTGLHVSEIELLIQLLHGLVDQGNTVVVIEHQLDVLRAVDWLIELGPGAGAEGGQIVAEGPPDLIAKRGTKTGVFLKLHR